MPSQTLSAYLADVSPTVNDPWHFVAIVAAWLRSAAGSFIDTPEERASVEKAFTTAYDALALRIAPANPALAALFVAMRGWAVSALDTMLVALAPAPAPTPTPVVPVVPQGSSR